MDRRRFLGTTLATATGTVAAGCMGFGEDVRTFEASRATVSSSARSETGYEEARREDPTLTRTYAGVDVEVTNRLTEYMRSATVLDAQEVARFSTYATPQVEVADQGPFNPVGDLSNAELAQQLSAKYDGVSDVQTAGERSVAALGESRTVSEFTAQATLVGGQSVEATLHVAKFPHGSDYVICIGIHPQAIDETARVDAMVGGLEHPA